MDERNTSKIWFRIREPDCVTFGDGLGISTFHTNTICWFIHSISFIIRRTKAIVIVIVVVFISFHFISFHFIYFYVRCCYFGLLRRFWIGMLVFNFFSRNFGSLAVILPPVLKNHEQQYKDNPDLFPDNPT